MTSKAATWLAVIAAIAALAAHAPTHGTGSQQEIHVIAHPVRGAGFCFWSLCRLACWNFA